MSDTSHHNPSGLLNGLTYSVPVAGTIRLGRVVTRNNRRLPEKDDQFTVTLKHKEPGTGQWAPHPIQKTLVERFGTSVEGVGDESKAQAKLRRIPIKIAFDNPNLSLSEQYAVFNRESRPMCVGNGVIAKRRDLTTGVVSEAPCEGPDGCPYGVENHCDAIARLIVQIDDESTADEFFILRTGSINAVSDCRTVLVSYSKLFGGLAELPMWLTFEAKSSSQSMQTTFWYASLKPRFKGMVEGAKLLKNRREADVEAGLDRQAYEDTLMALRKNGSFAEHSEDMEQFEDLIVGRFVDDTGEDRKIIKISGAASGVNSSVSVVSNALLAHANAQSTAEVQATPAGTSA
jgi:Recombination directionality factor-like